MNTAHTNDPSLRRIAVVALIAVNVLWGLSFPVVKALNLLVEQGVPGGQSSDSLVFLLSGSAWLIGLRFALAVLLVLVFCPRLVKTVRLPHVIAGAVIGVMFFAGLALQVAGLANIPASRSGFLTSLVVVWTPVFSTLLRRQWPRRQTMIGAIVSVIGVSVLTGMIGFTDGRPAIASDALDKWQVGDTLTSIAVLFFTVQILLVDYFGKRHESTAFTPSMFATTAVMGFVVFAFTQWLTSLSPSGREGSTENGLTGFWEQLRPWVELSSPLDFWCLIVALSVFSTLIAFLWMNRYQPVLSAGQAAVIYTLEPLFASMWAMFLPAWLSLSCDLDYENETLSLSLIVGGSILILANVITLWPSRGSQANDLAQ